MTTRGSLQKHQLDWFSLLVGLVTVIGALQAQYMSWGQAHSWNLFSFLLPSCLVVFGITGVLRSRRSVGQTQSEVETDPISGD